MEKKPTYRDMEKRNKELEIIASEAVRLQKLLQESEEKFRLFTESTPTAVMLYQDDRFIYANKAAETISGYSTKELIGMYFWEFLHPDYRELVRKRGQKRQKGKETTNHYEFKIITKDGVEKWVDLSGASTIVEGRLAAIITVIDITERKRVEDALRESEEQYTKLVDAIPDLIVRTDLEGKILFVNDYALQISGYKRDEIVGQNILVFVAPEDRERVIQNVMLMMESRLGPREYHLIMKDGRKISFEINGDVLRNQDGAPFGLVNVCRDISERKTAQDILQKSEEKYRQLAETAHDLIVTVDLDFKITYVNQATLNYAEGIDVIGRSLLDFTPQHLHDIQKEMMQKRREGLSDTLAFEWDLIYPQGKTVSFDIRASLMTEGGKPSGVLFIARDNSQRKQAEEMLRQSEEKFRKVFMATPDCVAITRLSDGLIMDANRGFEEITGWMQNEAIGRTFAEIRFWGDPTDRDFMKQELASGKDVLYHEFLFRRKDGVMRTGFYSARSIQIAKDACIIFSMQDITERRQLEEEHQKLEQQLFQAQKMDAIGQLAGGVAHDFNNMLSVIIGNTEMAMGRVGSSELIHNILNDTMNAAKRSAELTRQLLAFARKQTVSPKVLDLNDVVSGMLKMLQRVIGENIKLVWMPGRNLGSVRIDPSQVDQILVNLVVNARDAMKNGGTIAIETSNKICDEAYCLGIAECVPGEYILLTVSDNGCGMEKEVLNNIFEPFFTTKNVGQGTGLGLATVYGIVKQNGGFINAYSETGQGTSFKIYLPRYHAESLETTEDKEDAEIVGGTETILVVEDEPSVLKLSKDMMEMLGYKVLAASKTQEALKLVREYDGNINLLFTDVVMPEMNGKELSERITAIKPGLKCLYMSGYTADVIAREGVLDQGIKFISKPFSLKELAAKVREALG